MYIKPVDFFHTGFPISPITGSFFPPASVISFRVLFFCGTLLLFLTALFDYGVILCNFVVDNETQIQNVDFMGKFINPFTDYGWKILFGEEASKSILIEFLNDLLEGERNVKDIKYLKTETLPENTFGRGVIFDVLCISNSGEEFIVEMQNKSQLYVKDRFVYYMARAIDKQGVKGNDWKFALRPVYGVFLLNFTLDDNPCLRTDIGLVNMASGALFSDRLRMIFLQLPLFTKKEEECETNLDKWFYILTRMDTLERMPWKAQKAAFEKLMERAEISNFTPEERAQYEAQLDAYRVMTSAMEKSKLEGFQEGIQKGKLEGITAGEKKKAREIAAALKQRGFDTAAIAEISGLNTEEIEQLE